jgi:hypothetical protein
MSTGKPFVETKSPQAPFKTAMAYTNPKVKPTKPELFDPKDLESINTHRMLQAMARSIIQRVARGIKQSAFSPAAKRALATALKIEVKGAELIMSTKHPGFKPLVFGQKKEQMKWLTKSPTPIPIIDEHGKMIFRNATAKSMADGRWIHPGHKPTTIVEKAREEAKKMLIKSIRAELERKLREGMSG